MIDDSFGHELKQNDEFTVHRMPWQYYKYDDR